MIHPETSSDVPTDHNDPHSLQRHLFEALCRRRDQNSSHGYSLLLILEEYVRYNLQIRCSVKESVCWMISECRVHDIKGMQFGVKQSKFFHFRQLPGLQGFDLSYFG